MASRQEVSGFIRSTFRSVWALELLLFLKRNNDRTWSHVDLVTGLRGSDLVVTQGLESLAAAGLILTEENGKVRYQPVSGEIARLADQAEQLYARSPDAVRRLIVLPASDGLAAFADSFRLRKD